MAMWPVIIQNITSSSIVVEDLGLPIDATGEINISESFTYNQIAGSDDLRALVQSGDLVVNDGTNDLSASEGVKYLTIQNVEDLEDGYYDKTELQTSGQSQVHWDNITNSPSIEENTLDEAYNEGGPGAGRIITVDSGAVKLNAADSTTAYAPIELTPVISLPTDGLGGGQLAVKGDQLFLYDSSRSKWLSTTRQFLTFGRKGKSKNVYLEFAAGNLTSNNSGYRLARNATIISLAGQLDDYVANSCNFEIRKNDLTSPIETLLIAAASIGAQDITKNLDLSAGDYLQAFISGTVNVEDPVIIVEIAWRD